MSTPDSSPPDSRMAPSSPRQMTTGARLFTIGLLGALLLIIWLARDALAPYVFSLLIIYILLPVVRWMDRRLSTLPHIGHRARPIAAISSSIVALGFLLLLIGTLLNPILTETREMLLNFSTYWETLQTNHPDFREAYETWVPEPVQDWMSTHVQQIAQNLIEGVASIAGWLLHTTGSAVSTVLALVSIPLFIVYYLIDEKSTSRVLREQFPLGWSNDATAVFRIFDRVLGAYTRGVILESTIVGVITGFGYWVIGVNLFLPLAVVAFVGEIVPIVGPWIAFFISFPVVLATQPDLAIPAIAIFLVIQTLEGWFLAPQIQSSTNDFTSSGTLVILAIGGALAGGLGMVMALPAAGLARALAVYTYLRLQGIEVDESLTRLPALRTKPDDQTTAPQQE